MPENYRPEHESKNSEPVSPKRRRYSRSSSASSRESSPGVKNWKYENYFVKEERKSRSRPRFRTASSRSRSRSRERSNWSDQRDNRHGPASRSEYYDQRDDAQRQRQEAFIARWGITKFWILWLVDYIFLSSSLLCKKSDLSFILHQAFAGARANWWTGITRSLGIFTKSERAGVSLI